MDAGYQQISTHDVPLGPNTETLLADLQGGLDALHSLLSEIDAREQQLELETLRSILSQLDRREQERQTVSR